MYLKKSYNLKKTLLFLEIFLERKCKNSIYSPTARNIVERIQKIKFKAQEVV